MQNKCKIYTLDLTAPGAVPVRLTSALDATNEDRPAWSPDGTRIAFEQESGATNSEVIVRELATGIETNLTGPDPLPNLKPAWSPDSQFIYYSSGNPLSAMADSADIFRKPAGSPGATPTAVVAISGISEWQPSISPDGTKMCFTLQAAATTTADVVVVSITGTLPVAPSFPADILSDTGAGVGDYNCTWSPDGTKVAYVTGTFSSGALVQENYPDDDTSFRVLTDAAGVFDGNPDWAPDAPPTCPNITVNVPFNTATAIPLNCTDQGPAYERTNVTENIRDNPTNGVLDPIGQGDPSTVLYTPKVNFSGSDSFTYRGIDARQFGAFATVTLNVLTRQQSDTVKPDISALRVRPKKLKRGNALPELGATSGRRITFTLSEDATVGLKFERRTTGRRVGGKCRKATAASRVRKRCTRYVSAGRFSVKAKRGANGVRFQGRLSAAKRLALGSYRVSATAKDAAGNPQAQTRRTTFRLVRR
jgi:dipeptidyl aminopeptidase/acylaminoacyl peptidase